MSLHETIDLLLKEACPSIQYRIRAEILGERPSNPNMVELQEQILEDKRVIQDVR